MSILNKFSSMKDSASKMKDNIMHNRAINNLESKKKAEQKAVHINIAEMKSQIHKQKTKLGVIAYELCIKGEISHESFNDCLELINTLIKSIEEKNAEIIEIASAYDEEIQFLNEQHYSEDFDDDYDQPLPNTPPTQSQHSNNEATPVCSRCQAEYIADESIFCNICGNKL